MTASPNAVRARIRQIVALAQSATIQGEKDAAWGRVDALCAKHSIPRGEFARPGEPAREDPTSSGRRNDRYSDGPYARTHEYGTSKPRPGRPFGASGPFTFDMDDEFFRDIFRRAGRETGGAHYTSNAGRGDDWFEGRWERAAEAGPKPSDFAPDPEDAAETAYQRHTRERAAQERQEAQGRLYSAAAYLGAVNISLCGIVGSTFDRDRVWLWPGGKGHSTAGELLAEAERYGWTPHTDVDPALRARGYAKEAAGYLGLAEGPPWWYSGRRLGDWQMIVVALAAGWVPRQPWEGGR